jgi:hypothetical protein
MANYSAAAVIFGLLVLTAVVGAERWHRMVRRGRTPSKYRTLESASGLIVVTLDVWRLTAGDHVGTVGAAASNALIAADSRQLQLRAMKNKTWREAYDIHDPTPK